MEQTQVKDKKKAYVFLVVSVTLWAGMFIIMKIALNFGIPPGLVVALKMAFGAAFLFLLFFKQIRRVDKKRLKYGIIGGLFLGGATIMQTIGMEQTTVSSNAFVTATYVVFVPLISWLAFKRRPGIKIFIAVAIVILGVAVLTGVFAAGFVFNVGDIFALIGAVLFACQLAYVETIADEIEAGSFTFIELCISCVMGFIYFAAAETPYVIPPDFGYGVLVTALFGVVFTALAFYLQCRAQQYIPPATVAIVMSMESVGATLLSILLGLEVFRVQVLAGGALIMAAVVLAQVKIEKPRLQQRKVQ